MNAIPFAISFFRGHWKLITAALLLAVIGVQQLRVTGLKSSLSAEKAGRALDRKEYERAQIEATAKAYAAKIKREAEYEAEREKADLAAADLGERYRAAVLRYAAAQGEARRANLSEPASPASGSNGPDRSAVLPLGQLMIPEADAFICAGNQARLEAVREWALGLYG